MEYLNLCENSTLETMSWAGRCWSEKLDGMRCFWDGGVSRGVPVRSVPWGVAHKLRGGDERCTGLFSRNGLIIYAPDWWLDRLGSVARDGELWAGYGYRSDLLSITKRCLGDGRWEKVRLWQYGYPTRDFLLHRSFRMGTRGRVSVCSWVNSTLTPALMERLGRGWVDDGEVVRRVEEHMGPCAVEQLDSIINRGGEGIVVKGLSGTACQITDWRPDRRGWWKIKPFEEVAVRIVGVTDGMGRNAGRGGAYVVEGLVGTPFSGLRWNVNILGDDERATPRSGIIEVRYRGVGASGVPMECRPCPRLEVL